MLHIQCSSCLKLISHPLPGYDQPFCSTECRDDSTNDGVITCKGQGTMVAKGVFVCPVVYGTYVGIGQLLFDRLHDFNDQMVEISFSDNKITIYGLK